MCETSNVFRIKRKTVAYAIAILIALVAVTPVLADYLGPDRTVTETVDVCKVLLKKCSYVSGVYKYKTSNSWSCSLESKPWKSYPSSSASCNEGNFGYQYWTISNTQKDVTTTYPPASVNSQLQNCTLNNGWCNTMPQLVVSGDEPVLGYDIFAIEGSLNGQNFACSDDNCIVPLNEGNNTVDYWALSSWGDSSTKGTFTTKVDSQAPNITGTLSGTSGSNGWYLSPISLNSVASDVTSGLANVTCTLDGTALASCSSISVNSDGPHTLVLTASDNAGNTRTLNQSASIDTQNPTLAASLNGTLGSNSWYTAATLSASASDPTPGSGLSAIEYNLDNSTWTIFPGTGVLSLPNGKHSLDIRAVDNAGRTVSSSKTFWLDGAAPDITLNPNGTLGTNNWYTTSINLTASTTDETSGVDVFEYSLNNSAWTPYIFPLTLADGTHNISFWSQDQAGLVKQVDGTFQIDTRPPQIAGNVSGVLGSNGWYISDVTLSASASDPTPGSGLDTFTYILNNGVSTPYTDPVSLSDGQQTIQFNAQDQAGLSYSSEQTIKVDAIHPALTISNTPPNWAKDTITLNGVASDGGSGLSKVEITTDDGQHWQLATGTASWSYDWNTQSTLDGSHDVRVRVLDQAGLTTEKTINIKLDNHAPQISLPDSWLQWSSVTLDVWDDFSGVSTARVEISDPENHYPARIIDLDPNQFPLSFKWDRRFGNDEVAPSGTYNVKVIASDNVGHTAEQSASVKVVLSILPPGPTATSQPYLRATSTPIPTFTSVPVSSPTVTPTAVISGFGQIEPTVQAPSTPQSIPTPRATPTQTTVLDWLESFFVPDAKSTDSTELTSPTATDAGVPDSQSNILWGAAAAAMVGAATSYAQEERRKQQEEKERQAALEKELEKEAEERHDKMQARKLEKAEAQRQQEATWEKERNEQQDFIGGVASKLDHMDKQEEASWIAAQAATRQKYEEKKREEAAKKAEQVEAKIAADDVYVKPDNWWEKTKSFVYDKIIQPITSNVYEPFIEPAVDKTKQFIANESARINENFYQPYIQPAIEKAQQFVMIEAAKFNESIYQPYIKPAIDQKIAVITKDLSELNKKIYEPYLQPVVAVFNEKVYQPYIKPVLDKAQEVAAIGVSWVNNNIYQPYIQPIVDYIDQNIYTPIFKPVVDDVSSLWDKYGDWVHGALDTVGFIPGLGDIADGLNGLLYLGEGRYIEASVSLLAMIPLLGDLGKAGKWGVEIGAEVVEEVVEEVAEKVVKEAAEELVENAVEETVEEVAEKVVVEAGEELAEQTTKDVIEEVAERTIEETGEEVAEKIAKETVEISVEKGLIETAEKLVEDTAQATADKISVGIVKDTTAIITSTTTDEISELVAEKVTEKSLAEIDQEVTQRVLNEVIEGKVTKLPADVANSLTSESATELAQKLSEELGGKKVWVSAKTGSIYVSSPPAEGFALAKKLAETDLSNANEVDEILHRIAELTSRGSGNHVVLGPFKPNGAFIQEALDTNGIFWDVGDELWEALDKSGIDMFKANDQFIRVQMENGVERFDVIRTSVDSVLQTINDGPPIDWKDLKYTEKEIMDLATMPNTPYKLVDNSWVRSDLINSLH